MKKAYRISIFIPLLLLLLFLLAEGIRLGLVAWGIHRAAEETIRHTIAIYYDPKFCLARCEDIEDEYQARLLTQKTLLTNQMKKIPFGLGDPSRPWKSIFCSDRQGFTYNSTLQQCFPAESTGEDGGFVTLNITYTYLLGSSIGLSLAEIPLAVEKTARNECYRLGCFNALSIEFNQAIPEDFSITVRNQNGQSIINAICPLEGNGFNAAIYCGTNRITLYSFEPTDRVELIVHWNQEIMIFDSSATLTKYYPNGPRCKPVCTGGNVQIHIK